MPTYQSPRISSKSSQPFRIPTHIPIQRFPCLSPYTLGYITWGWGVTHLQCTSPHTATHQRCTFSSVAKTGHNMAVLPPYFHVLCITGIHKSVTWHQLSNNACGSCYRCPQNWWRWGLWVWPADTCRILDVPNQDERTLERDKLREEIKNPTELLISSRSGLQSAHVPLGCHRTNPECVCC